MTAVAPNESFAREPLPRLCNLDRLLHAMAVRGLDGIVATQPQNVFYLTSFNGVAHKADEPRPYAVILSRAMPEHPVMVVADYYLATFLAQPSWVADIRPFRAVMMPLDLPPRREDIDRFIPAHGAGVDWLERARESCSFDMATAVRGALRDLKLERGRVAFDEMGFGFRLGLEGLAVVDGYDPLMFARGQDGAGDAAPGACDAAERGRDLAHDRCLAEGRHVAQSEPRLCPGGDRSRRLCARAGRHGLGSSARYGPCDLPVDRPRGR
jgi:hypothetical protein